MSVINTNVSAMYSQNAMKTNARAMSTAMEQLSTGTRVNSAKDDAAGLAIGQNMTSQIRGLNQAVRNLNDGINMMQTAEGAMVEQSNMLQRMRELAVQSMNGTYSDVQRGYLDKEFQALAIQIGRVASDTMWNDQTLLNAVPAVSGAANHVPTLFTPAAATTLGGTLAAGTITVNGVTAVGEVTLTTQDTFAPAVSAVASGIGSKLSFRTLIPGNHYTISSTSTNAGTIDLVATGVPADDAAAFAVSYNLLGTTEFTAGTGADTHVLTSSVGTSTLAITAVRTAAQFAAGMTPAQAAVAVSTATRDATAAGFILSAGTLGKQAAGGTAYNGQQIAAAIQTALIAYGSTATVSANSTTGTITTAVADVTFGLGGGAASEDIATSNRAAAATAFGLSIAQLGTQAIDHATFQYQAGMSSGQTVEVAIGAMNLAGLGITGSIAITGVASATAALGVISSALETINSQRAVIGAGINRMEYAGDNLTNIASNATQSRSTIMDTDYAIATTQLAKTQIIQQAATAMLAQANQQPQGVMALLKG